MKLSNRLRIVRYLTTDQLGLRRLTEAICITLGLVLSSALVSFVTSRKRLNLGMLKYVVQ